MPIWRQPLNLSVAQLRGILEARASEQDSPTAVVDGIEILARFDSGRPQSVAAYGRASTDVAPPSPGAIGKTTAELILMLAGLNDTDVVDAIVVDPDGDPRVSYEITPAATAEPERPAPTTGQVFMAPAGTPLPTSLPADGWTPLGTVDGDVTLEGPSGPEGKSWNDALGALAGGFSGTLEFTAGPELRETLEALMDAQDDRVIDEASRAVDAMDLDRLAAELRLMLPEFSDLAHSVKPPRDLGPVDYGVDFEQGRPDGYSAEAIVAWFRQEVALARRRAYRTGYAMGRHAAEHGEPTA